MLYITIPRRIINTYHSATLMSFARLRQLTHRLTSCVLSRLKGESCRLASIVLFANHPSIGRAELEAADESSRHIVIRCARPA